MSHPGVGLDKWEDLPKSNSVYLGAGSSQHILRLAQDSVLQDSRMRRSGRIISTRLRSSTTRQRLSSRASCSLPSRKEIEKQGRLQAQRQHLPALWTTAYSDLLDPDSETFAARSSTSRRSLIWVQRFVDASAIGWYDYLYGDNAKANAMIKA